MWCRLGAADKSIRIQRWSFTLNCCTDSSVGRCTRQHHNRSSNPASGLGIEQDTLLRCANGTVYVEAALKIRAIVILLSDRSLSSGANNVHHHSASFKHSRCAQDSDRDNLLICIGHRKDGLQLEVSEVLLSSLNCHDTKHDTKRTAQTPTHL